MRDSTESNKRLIEAHYRATTSNFDPAAIDRQVADTFVDHGSPPNGQSGPALVKTYMSRLREAFPDLNVTIDDIVAEGDLVAVRGTWRGTHRGLFMGVAPTNRRVTFTGIVFWRVSNGKIVARWGNVDNLGLLRQLGVIK